MTVEPGEVRAPVLGSRSSAYRVRVRVRAFDDAEWDAVLDAIAARAGHAAALLDGELHPGVVDDAAAAGVGLLPGPGEVGTSCSCPDWANPCKHAAAVCYLIADALDVDPFALLLLRGRGREAVLAALRARRAAASPGAQSDAPVAPAHEPDPGVVARDLVERRADPLPEVPLPPAHPGRPAPLATDPPLSSGLDAATLSRLAADAARRAWELATGAGDGGLGLDERSDLARRAAIALDAGEVAALAARTGRSGRELVRLGRAWELGAAAGAAILEDRWDPPAELMAEAREALAAEHGREHSREHGRLRVEANRISLPGGGVQLRYGRDGCWYRLERRHGAWELIERVEQPG
jgi:hypothetical protein